MGVPADDPGLYPPDLASQAQNLRLGGLMSRCARRRRPRAWPWWAWPGADRPAPTGSHPAGLVFAADFLSGRPWSGICPPV